MNLFISLRYLVALDDHRHFGRAALACSVTQPALSNSLRALEEHFGASIVKRGRAFAGFTEEGSRILASARTMLREYERLEQDLRGQAEAPVGHLLIGSVPTAMPIAARFVAVLHARHPGIVSTLRSMSSLELESGLQNLALDLGLGYPERTDSGRAPLRVVPQYVERHFLLRRTTAPPADGLRLGPETGWAEAAGLPLCLLSAEMHNRAIVDRAFAAAGRRPVPAIETNSVLALALSVRAGRVCSILPGALVDALGADRELEAMPLVDPRIEVPVAFMAQDIDRPPNTLAAALALAREPAWRDEAARRADPSGSRR